jgi:hypothetical protein
MRRQFLLLFSFFDFKFPDCNFYGGLFIRREYPAYALPLLFDGYDVPLVVSLGHLPPPVLCARRLYNHSPMAESHRGLQK